MVEVPDYSSDWNVYIDSKGEVLPVDATSLLRSRSDSGPPRELVAIAIALLTEDVGDVEFIWTADEDVCRKIRLEHVNLGRNGAVHIQGHIIEELCYSLTRRELDVISLLIAGLPTREIAEALRLSPRTVSTHVEHLMRKLGVTTRSALATSALDSGLLGVPLVIGAEHFSFLRVGQVLWSAEKQGRPELNSASSFSKTPGKARTIDRISRSPAPVVIGSLVPLTGRAREDGLKMVEGATLAAEEINAHGGIHGRPLQLDVQNIDVDRPGLSSITQAMERLFRNGADAVTSGYMFHQEHAVHLAASRGVPLLHASASSHIDQLVENDLTRFRGVFHVCPSDENYAPNFIRFMTLLRDTGQWHPPSTDLVVAHQDIWETIDFGLTQAEKFARELGWNLIPLNVSDRTVGGYAWSTLPEKVGRPAAVMLGSYFVQDHLNFMDAFLRDPSDTLVYSIYAPSLPEFKERVSSVAKCGLLWASTTGTYSDDIARRFVQSYQYRFGTAPGRSMAGVAYDRIQILSRVWKQLGSSNDYDHVSEELHRTRYRGVNGSYTFDHPGHSPAPLGPASLDPSISQAHTVFQLQNGRDVLLGPEPYAAGTFSIPAWFQT